MICIITLVILLFSLAKAKSCCLSVYFEKFMFWVAQLLYIFVCMYVHPSYLEKCWIWFFYFFFSHWFYGAIPCFALKTIITPRHIQYSFPSMRGTLPRALNTLFSSYGANLNWLTWSISSPCGVTYPAPFLTLRGKHNLS